MRRMARSCSMCEDRDVKEGTVMKRDDVLRILAAHRDEFDAMGVRELAIRVFELRERLEEVLDAKVDLVTMGGLRHELREGILAEAIRAA